MQCLTTHHNSSNTFFHLISINEIPWRTVCRPTGISTMFGIVEHAKLAKITHKTSESTLHRPLFITPSQLVLTANVLQGICRPLNACSQYWLNSVQCAAVKPVMLHVWNSCVWWSSYVSKSGVGALVLRGPILMLVGASLWQWQQPSATITASLKTNEQNCGALNT